MNHYITGMVSIPCKKIVAQELAKMGVVYKKIEVGRIELEVPVSPTQMVQLKESLLANGLFLVEDPKDQLLQRVKNMVIEMLESEQPDPVNFSLHLSRKLLYNYTYLSNLFSERQGITLKRYIIIHRIAKAKQLLLQHFSLKEIAFKLHYSSVAHLSTQFKKITGITPTNFKQQYNPSSLHL